MDGMESEGWPAVMEKMEKMTEWQDEPDEVEMEEWPDCGWSPEKTARLDAPEIFHARHARGLVWPGQVDSPGWTSG